jgi:hypothetical protein
MHPNVIGALVNSALYLLCVFAAGLVTGHPTAWKLALIAMGVTYISHYLQLIPGVSRDLCTGVVVASIAIGAAAGIAIFF